VSGKEVFKLSLDNRYYITILYYTNHNMDHKDIVRSRNVYESSKKAINSLNKSLPDWLRVSQFIDNQEWYPKNMYILYNGSVPENESDWFVDWKKVKSIFVTQYLEYMKLFVSKLKDFKYKT